MPSYNEDLVITNKHKRAFIQIGGARPNNPVRYAGVSANAMVIEGVTVPESGGVDPIRIPDPHKIGGYKLVGRKITPADLATATLKILENHNTIPRQLFKAGCPFNFYEATGKCRDLSDFLRGWESYVLVYSAGLTTEKDLGTRMAWDADEQIETTLSITLADVYPIGALSFGEQASAEVDREVLDIVYGSNQQCGDCGPQDDGTTRLYAVTASSGAGSPGIPAELQYSLDGGQTWTSAPITGIGASANPSAIEIVGDKLVILVPSESAYYWATLNRATGVPGTFTKVTAGFTHQPNDIYVASPSEVYFCGNSGRIFKSTDITAGVSVLNAGSATPNNLLRIHGREETIVAVGANSTVVKTTNRGATWAATLASPSAVATDITAIQVLDQYRYWVGTLTGRIVYTLNGGETWVQQQFSGAGAGAVHDILFVNDEVGYFSHSTSTPTARVFGTWDGGASWVNEAPRIANWPTFNRATRLAAPKVSDNGVCANNLAVAGLSGGGTDGIILIGAPSVL